MDSGYSPTLITRSEVLTALAGKGWNPAQLHVAIRDLFPRGIRLCPKRDQAYENVLTDLESVPSFFARFTDGGFVNSYLKPAVDDQVLDVGFSIEQTVRALGRTNPAIRRHEPDIIQQVFVALCTPNGNYYDPAISANFDGWLYWVVRNQANQYVRAEHRHAAGVALSEIGEPAVAETHTPTYRTDIVDRLTQGCGPSDARVYQLRYEQRWSVEQIAEAERRTPAAVYKQLTRLKEKIRSLGQGYFAPLDAN